MFPMINNKSFMDCVEDDFKELLHNPDYRESQYIEYKTAFSFIDEENKRLPQGIVEFRNDICSFANADGGYIIYGIREKQGIADEIIGIDINNPDLFELDLHNKLVSILPKVPPFSIKPVPLENGRYLVVIQIQHDYYAPYVHIENEKNYKIYKRDGNRKTLVGYMELKNMFVQSRVLEDEVLDFREKRIRYYRTLDEKKYGQFMLLHIIPESFLSERKQLFILERQNQKSFMSIFAGTGIDRWPLPCVDGLHYYSSYGTEEALLYNNGIAEFVLPLQLYVYEIREKRHLNVDSIWGFVDNIVQGYRNVIPAIFGDQRYFVCINLIGCRNIVSESDGFGMTYAIIDRDEVLCNPISFSCMSNKDAFFVDLKKLHLEYLLSLSIKKSSTVNSLIKEITGS